MSPPTLKIAVQNLRAIGQLYGSTKEAGNQPRNAQA